MPDLFIPPADPGLLLQMALDDLEAVTHDPRFSVDMSMWWSPALQGDDGAPLCAVCLAGSMLVRHCEPFFDPLRTDRRSWASFDDPISLPARWQRAGLISVSMCNAMHALDQLRRGFLFSALKGLVAPSPEWRSSASLQLGLFDLAGYWGREFRTLRRTEGAAAGAQPDAASDRTNTFVRMPSWEADGKAAVFEALRDLRTAWERTPEELRTRFVQAVEGLQVLERTAQQLT